MPTPAHQKKIPQRRCVGCMESKDKRSLIRVVRTPDGAIILDATGKKSGRGAYICPDAACLKKARKGDRLSPSLDTQIPDEIYAQLEKQLSSIGGDPVDGG